MPTPNTLDAALSRIQELETQLATVRHDTVREVLQHLRVHGSEFHFNEPNNYGHVDVTIWTGAGNPWDLYRGIEHQQEYLNGMRGSGYYQLNEAAVQMFVEQLDDAAERRDHPKDQA